MAKKRRTYLPRIVGGKVMMPADLKRLHKYMLEVEHIDHISDEMQSVVEREWPELAIDAAGRKVKLPRGASDAALLAQHFDPSNPYIMERTHGIAKLDAGHIARAVVSSSSP